MFKAKIAECFNPTNLSERDLAFEEDVKQYPYHIRCWWFYIQAKREELEDVNGAIEQIERHDDTGGIDTPLTLEKKRDLKLKFQEKERINQMLYLVYERAIIYLPGSYKLWYNYLIDRIEHCKKLCINDPLIEETNNCFDRCLTFLHKMPRIWMMYCEFLTWQRYITRTRKTFDRALKALPITQHDRIWPLYIKFVKIAGVTETAVRVYRRYIQLYPEMTEDFIDYLVKRKKFDEACVRLCEIVNDNDFVSRKQQTKYDLWKLLCKIMVNNAKDIKSVKVDAIIRSGIRKYPQEIGILWANLAEYYVRLGMFEKARDIYEEAIESVTTVRDFTVVFDAYCKMEESIIEMKLKERDAIKQRKLQLKQLRAQRRAQRKQEKQAKKAAKKAAKLAAKQQAQEQQKREETKANAATTTTATTTHMSGDSGSESGESNSASSTSSSSFYAGVSVIPFCTNVPFSQQSTQNASTQIETSKQTNEKCDDTTKDTNINSKDPQNAKQSQPNESNEIETQTQTQTQIQTETEKNTNNANNNDENSNDSSDSDNSSDESSESSENSDDSDELTAANDNDFDIWEIDDPRDVELRMDRYEALHARREILKSSVLLRQNRHNVDEWLHRVEIYLNYEPPNAEMAVLTYQQAVTTVDPKQASGSKHRADELWIEFAKFFEEYSDDIEYGLTQATQIFEEAIESDMINKFNSVESFANIYCEWAEMLIRNKKYSDARNILRRATTLPSRERLFALESKEEHGTWSKKQSGNRGGKGGMHLSIKDQLYKNQRVWFFMADMEESLGSLDECRSVYNTILDLKIATVQTVLNYADLLEKHKYFEECFQVYERGIALFDFPNVLLIWKTYLYKFISYYKGTKLERTRDLFEQCVKKLPSELTGVKDIFLLYARLEENYGFARHAMRVYDRACKHLSNMGERFEMYKIYINRAADLFGITKTREIYEQCIEMMDEKYLPNICLSYISLELKLSEIDRARAIYQYGSQFANPKYFDKYWEQWYQFEITYGNEDTFKEMKRIRRSVDVQYTQVSYAKGYDIDQLLGKNKNGLQGTRVEGFVSAGIQQPAGQDGKDGKDGGGDMRIVTDNNVMDVNEIQLDGGDDNAMAALERQAAGAVGQNSSSDWRDQNEIDIDIDVGTSGHGNNMNEMQDIDINPDLPTNQLIQGLASSNTVPSAWERMKQAQG